MQNQIQQLEEDPPTMTIKEEDQEKEEGSVKLDRSSTSKLKAKNLDQS